MDQSEAEGRMKILFVDDEENVLRSLKRLFMDQPYEIYTATSGQEGLEILESGGIGVIISDMRMPRMNGAEFLQRAGRLSPDSVRIILTGHADMDSTIDAINKGSTYRYITKPWNDDEIIATVQDGAERYRLIQENRYLVELTRKQNEDLKKWSAELEMAVQEQTIELTYKHKELLALNEKLKTDFKGFVVTMSNLIEMRDAKCANHSNNVAAISRKIAVGMDLGSADIQDVAIAAQLHDIGKIGISDAVLRKETGAMAPFELREYQTHSIRGQAAIDSIDALRTAGFFIRHHHESFDGKGFPDGLKGSNIPPGSRILAIADAYDRLSAHHTSSETMGRINELAGTQFDPHLCVLLTRIAGEMTGPERRAGRTGESEMHPDQLLSGMVLSRDVRSGTGILLLPQETTLSVPGIDSIKRYYDLDPPRTGVYIYTEGR